MVLALDPTWSRLPAGERRRAARGLLAACLREGPVRTLAYSCLGLRPAADLLLWSLGPSLEALEERAAAVLRSDLGARSAVGTSLLGVIAPSPYSPRAVPAEPPLFAGERARYLVLYPFTKSAGWYRLGPQVRQGIMNEHIRVGRRFPQVRQLLASSFGLNDQDYLVAYETADTAAFSELVRELRATEGRRATVRDTPVLVAVHRPPDEMTSLLAG
jgi:chlorite dismutase